MSCSQRGFPDTVGPALPDSIQSQVRIDSLDLPPRFDTRSLLINQDHPAKLECRPAATRTVPAPGPHQVTQLGYGMPLTGYAHSPLRNKITAVLAGPRCARIDVIKRAHQIDRRLSHFVHLGGVTVYRTPSSKLIGGFTIACS